MAVGVEEECDVVALREALRQQAHAVNELRAELEEERQAAALGADEAQAMIVRLQAEKAAKRMEAEKALEQFRWVAEERIQHDEDTLAFLKAVVFHKEMEISSLNRRLLAIHATRDDPLWKVQAKSGTTSKSRRNVSLPAAHLEQLCSELDIVVDTDAGKKSTVGDRRAARMVSDIDDMIGREKEWTTRPNLAAPTPKLHRSASHWARVELFRGSTMRRALSSPGIAEEDEKPCRSNAAFEADIDQIKVTVQSLQIELTKLREPTHSQNTSRYSCKA